MRAQLSQTIQYFYFLRFSLFVWLFPVVFAFADSGWLPFSTRTLSRGIFVPEYSSGYCCVAFFLVSKGFASLISGRTVVLNGQQRFRTRPPNWMKNLLANDEAKYEFWPVLLSQIPALLTFFYLELVGMNEGVSGWEIARGILCGVGAALIFWYVINAWYYLVYERPGKPKLPNQPPVLEELTLGENAARTILFPRWCFGLNRPGPTLTKGRESLEDITTLLRGSWVARGSQRLTAWLGSIVELSGYVRKGGEIFEAQIFSVISTIAFAAFFWILYPPTAPAANEGVRFSVLALALALLLLLTVTLSGTGIRRSLLWPWKVGLSVAPFVFCSIILVMYLNTNPDRFPVLASVLLLVIVVGWVFSALAFFFDRYRVPVLTIFLLATLLPRIPHLYGSAEEHYASTVPLKLKRDIPTPAQILDERLNDETTQPDRSRPFVIVTATGGGLHASAWTARVLGQVDAAFEELDEEKDSRPGEKPQASMETELFHSHILLLSTVSGGSVGLSYYLRELDPTINGGKPNFDRMAVAAQCSSLEAVGWGLVYYDLEKAIFPLVPLLFPASPGDGDLGESPLGKDRTWALRKGFERNSYDAYCIRSADGSEQGAASKPGAPTQQVPWYRRLWFPAAPGSGLPQTLAGVSPSKTLPAFTMNTTTVEAGDRFLLANYRLPDYQIGPVEGAPAESFLHLFVNEPRADLPLPSAAQLSATFPYVSSAARIPAKYASRSEHFVDGGYYDNDGTSSVIEFLRYALEGPLDPNERSDDANYPKTVASKLTKISHGKLRVILIEIRNSQDNDLPQRTVTTPRVTEPSFTADPKTDPPGLLEQLGFPLEGFWNAGHGSVTGRDRNGLDLLIKAQWPDLALRHIIVDNVTDPTSQFGIKSADNPLSWSLTPHEREQIRESADPGNGLGNCYLEVVTSFEMFDEVARRPPMRCHGKAPLKKGAEVSHEN